MTHDVQKIVAEFNAEVAGIQAGIVRWLKQHPVVCAYYVGLSICANRTHDIDDAVACLGQIEEGIFVAMDAKNWVNLEDHLFDVWQCAVHGAIAELS